LKNIFDDISNQLSSIEKLSNELNSQNYLPKDPYETQIQTYIPNIPNYLLIYTDITKGTIPNFASSDSIFNFSNYGRDSSS
jgi:hypothetical protein